MSDLVASDIGDVVPEGADSLDILTPTEAKAALNALAVWDSDDNPELAQVITAASRLVDSVYGPVVKRTVTDERHTGGGRSLFLRQRPVASITTVTEYSGGTATVLTGETELVAGTYRFDADLDRLHRRSSWTDAAYASQSVIVTYVAGRYDTTADVDKKFKEAAAVALIHLWQHRGSNSGAAIFGGEEGQAFGGVPFSSKVLRDKLIALYPEEWLGPALA